MSGLGSADPARRVPRLTVGCDPTRLDLSPAEGFLLSRIDGNTPQGVLREVGGLPPAEVDRCLERWARAGVVEFGEGARRAPARPDPGPAGPATGGAAPPEASAPADVDPDLDIAPEVQRAVIAMEGRLDRPYHEILGVAADADARTIKRAYFGLSK